MEDIWSTLQSWLIPLLPALGIVAATVVVFSLLSRKPAVQTQGHRFRGQLWGLFVVLASLIGIILTLPLESDTRGQLLTLLGLLLTAIITLSSPTIAANAMAGFMLRSQKSFTPGDFIQVGDHFGRVTEQDLFHTEIQTIDRDLLTLPNLYLSSNPFKVVHASGTIISAEVSLGYDVDNHLVEGLLIQAAAETELADPFVQIVELGDFSVVYRVSGFLENVKQMLSVRSQLRRNMMDCLHNQNIEIASPSIMNQRPLTAPIIPERSFVLAGDSDNNPEARVFDKAEQAQQIIELENHYNELKAELESPDMADDIREKKVRRLKAIKRALKSLEQKSD
ncbi:MAG: mechanosensitive ion channel [Candidatus Pelagadaptatus aseana]|uniref:mechanosensitive ion channel family protein n=1 Tax=Candidatus Pelagadaptatus aseana TaxID=3120508 RepID=UPI0039B284A9